MTDAPLPPADPLDDPLVGSVLAGRYRIVRRLGVGAMGSVYLGEHLRFGRLDAIKILKDEMARDREATERFLRGARNVSAVKHPNVCTVYDFGDTDDGRQFLAMEFVEGQTLAELLEREGRLPLERAVEVTRQIAGALDAAHAQGIVHRDLKPGNVMLARAHGGGDQVKVVDFDIAKGSTDGEGHEVTRTGFVVGTPEYMSPEQLTGDPLDGRSDVYSLAVVFVRILTGSLPVRATSTQDLMVERLTAEPVPLAELSPELDLPPGLQAAVDRGLQRRRDDRPATAGQFAASLVRALDGPAPSTPSRPGSPAGIPATTVEPRSAPAERTAPSATGAGRPGWVPWAAGIAGLAVAAIAFSLVADGDGGAESTLEPGAAGPSAMQEDPGQPDPGGQPTTPSDSVGDPQDAAEPDSTRPGPDVPDESGERSDPPPADDPRPALSALQMEDALWRQMDAVTEAPSDRTWSAAADTAALAWGRDDLPDAARALAAYLAASALEARGRVRDAVPWAQRAVRLAPDNPGFRRLLERLGGRP